MGLEVAARLGDWSWQADLKANLGEDYLYTGRFDEAEKLLQEAFDNAKKATDTDAIAWVGGILGDMYLESGRPTEAVRCLEDATQLLERTGATSRSQACMLIWRLHTWPCLNVTMPWQSLDAPVNGPNRARRVPTGLMPSLKLKWLAPRLHEQAGLRFEQAIQLFDEAGSRQFGAGSRRNLARFLAERGESARSMQLLEDALATFRELNLPLEVTRTEQLLQTPANPTIGPSHRTRDHRWPCVALRLSAGRLRIAFLPTTAMTFLGLSSDERNVRPLFPHTHS